MKRNILYSLMVLLGCAMFTGCANRHETAAESPVVTEENTKEETRGESEPDEQEEFLANPDSWQETVSALISDSEEELLGDLYGDYRVTGGEIAFVCDTSIADEGLDKAVYKGIRTYALAAGVSFSYYVADENMDESYLEVIERAVSNEAGIIVCAGNDFGEAVGLLQEMYPEVSFLLIDCVPTDDEGNETDAADNVHCVFFREEQSGYLAGYLAVMDGYRSFGFIGGKEVPSVQRYGYGYLQGINDAAEELELTDVTVNYWYADAYQPEQEISDKASRWYSQGTEVIFACGGLLYESVLEAAGNENGLLIGVDVDQSVLSERFVTSAMKDFANAVVISLDNYYASGGRWTGEFAGQETLYGAENDCIGIPVINTEWRFKQVTKDDYYKVYRRIRFEDITVSDEIDRRPKVSVVVNYE